jgi:hypothetical protein
MPLANKTQQELRMQAMKKGNTYATFACSSHMVKRVGTGSLPD